MSYEKTSGNFIKNYCFFFLTNAIVSLRMYFGIIMTHKFDCEIISLDNANSTRM